ncbi:DUF1816 domain-containing protein [Leptolyngbya cf. ectocarpi LEGE 11479]|uniref:DUF1816 domain-containing protein n=1 Tax=Leptolyngbya cf. ectocarpi LEGE 11479 TaxID=1828722 RepID=A0A928WYU4_LEPEC|nr:DUF1816 domain-containing protein [Leptolyngbya ectocarpi]MBE9065357.1 DUF1816 domain-containing protein [Leptolyngbya cf. ectocarpi LEGE 11479]
MKNFLSNLFSSFSKPWWVEISTSQPRCLYYFGPFDSELEAIQHQEGYIEDLEQEGAQQIDVTVKCCAEPALLTVEYTEPSNKMTPVYNN